MRAFGAGAGGAAKSNGRRNAVVEVKAARGGKRRGQFGIYTQTNGKLCLNASTYRSLRMNGPGKREPAAVILQLYQVRHQRAWSGKCVVHLP